MAKENLDDYQLFYMEIPQVDYLSDIEIQDEYEKSDLPDRQGLSDEQVSKLAEDSLDNATAHGQADDNPIEPSLFEDSNRTGI